MSRCIRDAVVFCDPAWLQSFLVDRSCVHARGVVVANLLLIGSSFGTARGGMLEHRRQNRFMVLASTCDAGLRPTDSQSTFSVSGQS